MVLEGRLRQGAQRRVHRPSRRARLEAAVDALDDAHVSGGRRGQPRRANRDTPWAYRDAKWAEVIVGVDPSPAKKDELTDWARSYWEATHPYSAGGAYVNFMMDEGEDRVKATYRDNYARLAIVKAKYDKGNLFRVNQNIRPAATPV